MKKLLLTAALMASIYIGGTATVQAQNNCAPRDAVVSILAEQYGETVVSRGITSRGNVLEILANPDTGTWTALVSNPSGLACQVGEGEFWQDTIDELVPSGSPA